LEDSLIRHAGNIFVLSAPSGAGKSTLAKRLVQQVKGLIFSVSFTTRPPREGERDGLDYFFVDDATFSRMVDQGGFVEWVEVYGHRYGTGKDWIQDNLQTGVDILLDIETVGARNVHREIPEAIMIFLLPPDANALSLRLRGRGKDSEAQIRIRLQYARHEMEAFSHYDYLIVNDDLESAYRHLESIILATRCHRERMASAALRILASFPDDTQEIS
jgi:guanylate kinase